MGLGGDCFGMSVSSVVPLVPSSSAQAVVLEQLWGVGLCCKANIGPAWPQLRSCSLGKWTEGLFYPPPLGPAWLGP